MPTLQDKLSPSPIKQDYVHEMCNGFTTFVEQLPHNLTLKYIFYRRGQRNDAIEMEKRFFQTHPAGQTALTILRKSTNSQNSAFHGLAIATTSKLLGLRENRTAIGLITLNVDNYQTTEALLHEAYHLGWMAIDTARLLNTPKYKNSLKSGPLIPKRSPINMAKATLKADIFASLMLADQGYEKIIKQIAYKRCLDALSANTNGKPWSYPYPLAYETTAEAYKTLIDPNDKSYHVVSTPLKFAATIANTIEDEKIQQWWNFCQPAQTMAWQDASPEEILSNAINTSEDPIIKVTASLVKACTGLPVLESKKTASRNPFISEAQNKIYHEQAIEETFELVLTQGLETKSAQPFIDAANRQNQRLTEGKVLGWCASALQSAARTFSNTNIENQEEARNLIKLGYQAEQQEMKYESLIAVGEKIIERRKMGEIITLEDIDKMAQQQTFSSFISTSIKQSIKDPDYQKSLNATKDMNNIYLLEPDTPTVAPSAAPTGPAPAAAPQVGMGGMMGGTVSAPPQQQSAQTTPLQEDGNKKDGDNKKAE